MAITFIISSCAPMAPDKFWEKKRRDVDLSKAKYEVVRTNVVGTSTGFAMALGIITIKSASYVDAINDLYSKARLGGGEYIMVEVMEEKSSLQFLLFSFPKIQIRANLVEIIEEE